MKKGGFIKDALVLFIITLISGLLLGAVYDITKAPIEAAENKAKQAAYLKVFPEAKNFEENPAETEKISAMAEELFTQGFGNVLINEVVTAKDSGGNTVGRVVTSTSKEGYGGNIKVSVGIDAEGTITGITFLTLAETPGLGMRAQNESFYGQFANKKVEKFSVTKTPASSDDQINAISGSTITSNAVTNAVNAALYFNSALNQ